jgi:hypothetical protein
MTTSTQHGDHDRHGPGGHADDAPADLPDQPIDLDDSDVGAGASTGVWVVGLLMVVLIMLAFFAL